MLKCFKFAKSNLRTFDYEVVRLELNSLRELYACHARDSLKSGCTSTHMRIGQKYARIAKA